MTKKVLAVSLVLCVIFAASSAIAFPKRQMHHMPPHQCGFHGGFHDRFSPDVPKEIRAMMSEVAKLRIDLDDALYANPMDRAKAFEIHDKIMKLEQDIERWKFVQRVDRIEKFRKHREENRNRRRDASKPEVPESEQESK